MPGSNAGTGQPHFFRCPVERSTLNQHSHPRDHVITLTGRSKPYRAHRGGVRITPISREYICSCGHTGWSAHVDLARMAGENKYLRFNDKGEKVLPSYARGVQG
jgi:hypothetical protein